MLAAMTSYPASPHPDFPQDPVDPSRQSIPPYPAQPAYPAYAVRPPPVQPPPVQPSPGSPAAGPRRFRARWFVAAVAIVAVVAAGGGAAAGVQLADRPAALSTLTTTGTATTAVVSPSDIQTVADVAAEALPSVVTIEVTGAQESGTGSGVIIRDDGYILTNNHVVAAAEGGTMTVEFSDGRRAAATLVGADASSDLAVIRVAGVDGLQAATFADSDAVVVGELAVAIGSPLGLDGTVTTGVVSAVHRPVRTGTSRDSQAVIDAIQTDTAINPGNSGGPLLDADGDVIGINSAIATVSAGGDTSELPGATQSGNIGVGFAIPSNTAKDVADQLIDNGSASHTQLGVEGSDYSDADVAGAQIQSVVSGGPAEQAGLRAGDVIVELDGRAIEGVDTLVVAVRDHAAGDEVPITYVRGGQERTATVTLVESARG